MHGSFAAQPMSGILQGNEKHNVSWLFAPSDKNTYNCTASCSYGSIPSALAMQVTQGQFPSSPASSQTALSSADLNAALVRVFSAENLTETLPVQLVGQGTVGALTLQPTSIDFGTLAVGYPVKRSITLLNQSGGNLRYSITCRQIADSDVLIKAAQNSARDGLSSEAVEISSGLSSESQDRPTADSAGFHSPTEQLQTSADVSTSENDSAAQHLVIEEPQGILAARATKTLTLTLTPQHRKQYSLQLICETATANALDSREQASAVAIAEVPASLCAPPVTASIQGFSTYPTLMITDIVCQGWEKPFAWTQMSCSKINTDLADELSQVSMHGQQCLLLSRSYARPWSA